MARSRLSHGSTVVAVKVTVEGRGRGLARASPPQETTRKGYPALSPAVVVTGGLSANLYDGVAFRHPTVLSGQAAA